MLLTRGELGSASDYFFSSLIMWMVADSGKSCDHDKYRPLDMLFSMEHSKGCRVYSRVLQRKDMSTAIKGAAIFFHLDPVAFSVYSLRIGAATLLTDVGADDNTVSRMLDHVEGSTATRIYQRSVGRDIRPLTVNTEEGFGIDDLHRVLGRVRTREDVIAGIPWPPPGFDHFAYTGPLVPPTWEGPSPADVTLAAKLTLKYPPYNAGPTVPLPLGWC